MLSNTDQLAKNEEKLCVLRLAMFCLVQPFMRETQEQWQIQIDFTLKHRRKVVMYQLLYTMDSTSTLTIYNEGKPSTIFQMQSQSKKLLRILKTVFNLFPKYTVTKSTTHHSNCVSNKLCKQVVQVSSILKCDKYIFRSAPVCVDVDYSQNEEKD